MCLTEMRNCLLFLLVFCNFSIVLSQDILVLRKNEEIIKCRIIVLNDSIVTYRPWKSTDTTTFTVKKFEVQSFLIDSKSQKSKSISLNEPEQNSDVDILGEYRSGTVVPGYVLLNSGDSIFGFINVKNFVVNQLKIEFSDSTNHTRFYSIDEAKGYGYYDINYERVPLNYKQTVTNEQQKPQQSYFLHLTVNGPSKLYRFYVLHFSKSTMDGYNQNPPYYLGKLKRQFVITNPKGKTVFTQGRTIKGAVNRIYFDYPEYTAKYPVTNPKSGDLPAVVESFNYWYEHKSN